MTNAKGSKSVRTTKPKTDAKQATVAALSDELNRRLAASPERNTRTKQKAEPTVPTTIDVPDWAKRAAARDTASEMALVPEAAPKPEAASEAPAPKKGRPAKAAHAKAHAAKPVPGSLRAIGDGWLGSLKAAGHTPSTISSYGNDLAIAYEHLGADAVAADITEKQIAGFNTSKGVVKKANGKPKAQPTILKTRRALRLALTWAEQKGLIKTAPFPAKSPA